MLTSGDDYRSTGKPVIDWDDKTTRDGYALLAALDGLADSQPVSQAMRLLATILGQDLETGEDATLRIARQVAPDRVISTVDSEARHGHKTSHRGFDGYQGHIAIDPDAEAITAGNVGDVDPSPGSSPTSPTRPPSPLPTTPPPSTATRPTAPARSSSG